MYTFQTTHTLTAIQMETLNRKIHILIREYIEEQAKCSFDVNNFDTLKELTNTILEQAKYPKTPARSERT